SPMRAPVRMGGAFVARRGRRVEPLRDHRQHQDRVRLQLEAAAHFARQRDPPGAVDRDGSVHAEKYGTKTSMSVTIHMVVDSPGSGRPRRVSADASSV
ncbi:MAG: hypothetical protein KDF63_13555, partial [Rhodoferax sp.]|nr:hypothetical protein [Rhodoferax sp.]